MRPISVSFFLSVLEPSRTSLDAHAREHYKVNVKINTTQLQSPCLRRELSDAIRSTRGRPHKYAAISG